MRYQPCIAWKKNLVNLGKFEKNPMSYDPYKWDDHPAVEKDPNPFEV